MESLIRQAEHQVLLRKLERLQKEALDGQYAEVRVWRKAIKAAFGFYPGTRGELQRLAHATELKVWGDFASLDDKACMANFSKVLDRVWTSQKLTDREASELLGCAYSAANKLRNGAYMPSRKMSMRIGELWPEVKGPAYDRICESRCESRCAGVDGRRKPVSNGDRMPPVKVSVPKPRRVSVRTEPKPFKPVQQVLPGIEPAEDVRAVLRQKGAEIFTQLAQAAKAAQQAVQAEMIQAPLDLTPAPDPMTDVGVFRKHIRLSRLINGPSGVTRFISALKEDGVNDSAILDLLQVAMEPYMTLTVKL